MVVCDCALDLAPFVVKNIFSLLHCLSSRSVDGIYVGTYFQAAYSVLQIHLFHA